MEKNSEENGKAFCPVGIYRGESLRVIPEEVNCVYIVECRDGSYYTGWTNHPALRLQAHNEGRGAKYTKSRRPVHFVYMETYETKEEAMSREFFIKKMKRPGKKQLIAGI
jgi:putative endonuclease